MTNWGGSLCKIWSFCGGKIFTILALAQICENTRICVLKWLLCLEPRVRIVLMSSLTFRANEMRPLQRKRHFNGDRDYSRKDTCALSDNSLHYTSRPGPQEWSLHRVMELRYIKNAWSRIGWYLLLCSYSNSAWIYLSRVLWYQISRNFVLH